jgi:hypothetical protein
MTCTRECAMGEINYGTTTFTTLRFDGSQMTKSVEEKKNEKIYNVKEIYGFLSHNIVSSFFIITSEIPQMSFFLKITEYEGWFDIE